MKKALVVLLSLLCVMSSVLFAGGSSEGSSGEIVLDFPTWQAEEGGFALFWKDMVEQFEASHPNVKINMTQIPFNQFTDILITRYSANDAPDITHIASRFFEQFASQGWFENLDPYFEEAGILEDWTSLQSSMVYNGHNEGLLVLGYGFVLYYNEQILNEAGVSVPTTVDELKDAILAIEALGNPDISAFGVTTMQHSNTYQDFSNFVVGEGSALVKDGKYNLTSPEVIKAAEDYNFVASRAPKGVSTEMLRQLFVDGKVAMIIDGSFVVPLLETADEDIKPYLKVAKTPFEYTPGTISNSLHMSANLSDERKALVWEFMQQVASPENQVLYANYTQGPCGRLSSSEGISDPMIAFMNEVGADTRSILPDSANLMRNYSRFTDTVITYVLQLQNEGADVSGIMAALEADLLKNSLEP